MIEDGGREEEFKTILAELYEDQKNKNKTDKNNEDEESDWEPLIQLILSRKSRSRPLRRIPGVIRYAAAAAILIGIFFTTYVLIQSNQSKSKQTTIAKTDVAPAGNKAILYLANGAKIMLDSAQNGTLTTQEIPVLSRLIAENWCMHPADQKQQQTKTC